MTDRRTVRVTLYDGDYDGLNVTVPEAVALLQKIEAQIPPEFRDSSRFVVEQEHDYYGDSSSLTLEAYYDRPETDPEMEERKAEQVASEAQARRYNEQREREIYEMLRRKFG